MTNPFSPAAFRLTDLLQDAASRAVAVDPRDLNSPRGNLALLGDMNYRRQADGRYEAQPQVDALGVTEARASAAYMLEEWNGNHGQPAGRLVSFGSNQLRAGRLGIIRETAAITNKVPNPRGLGARVGTLTGGSPTGALPTGWSIGAQGGVTWTLVDYALVNGVERVTIRFSGTANASIVLNFLGDMAAAWGTASQNTVAFNARLVAGSLTNLGTPQIDCVERNGDGSSAGRNEANLSPLDAIDRRYVATRTRSGGTGQFVQPRFLFLSASGAVDCTVEISIPQAQDGAVASHPVITPAGADPAASTKAASTFTPATALNTRSTRRFYPGGWDFQQGGLVNGQFTERLPNATMAEDGQILLCPGNTNLIRNPRAEGAVPGSPGTNPTHWLLRPDWASGLNPGTTIVAVGVERGWDYIEVIFDNSANGAAAVLYFRPEAIGAVSASNNQNYMVSAGLRVMEGAITSYGYNLLQYDASNVFLDLTGGGDQLVSFIGVQHRRTRQRLTTNNASVASIVPEIRLTVPANTRTRMRLYTPQLSLGAFATPPVVPPRGTLATSTAATDALAFPVSTDWLRSMAQGAMLVDFAVGAIGYSGAIWGIFPWEFFLNNDNSMRLRVASADGSTQLQRLVGGVLQQITGPTLAAGARTRAVFSWGGGTGKLSVNGAAIISGAMDPAALAVTSLRVGVPGVLNTLAVNQLTYFPTALSDADIVALSRL